MFRSFVVLLLLATASPLPDGQLAFHVSPNGRVPATGSEVDPFLSIEQARDQIRELQKAGATDNGQIEVFVHTGTYVPSSTLQFTAEDSGTKEAPIVYRAIGGDVLITGGVEFTDWHHLTRPDLLDRLPSIARDHVVFTDLVALGIEPGTLRSRRLHQQMNSAPLELFVSQQRLPRAGWPNQGWAIAKAHGPISWKLDREIRSQDQRDAWAVGFWAKDWDSSFEPIAFDLGSKSVSLSSTEALRPKQVREGARYRLSNLIGELDSPGEWYLDETSGLVLYWPIEDMPAPSGSVLDTILSIYDTEYVTFEGFRFESARSMNVEIVGGCDVHLKSCSLSQAGTVAVHVFGGSRHRIVDCDISCTGSSAVRIEGGDRNTLEPCDHTVENCHIYDFCQNYLAGRAAVAIYGVGVNISTNHIHHGPDVAIALFGNEHLIEHNEIAHVCSETEDSAAIHLSFDPTYRGNVIRKNYIHDLGGFSKTGVVGIYLDDFASGTLVDSNLLQNTIRGIAIGGGRDNRIENNVIQNSIAPIQVDARGLSWARDQIDGEGSRISELFRTVLAEAPILGQRYPELLNLFEDEPAVPKGNVCRSNLFDGPRGVELHGIDQKIVVLENNRRRTTAEIASSDTILRELGIELRSNLPNESRETKNSRPRYVGRTEK